MECWKNIEPKSKTVFLNIYSLWKQMAIREYVLRTSIAIVSTNTYVFVTEDNSVTHTYELFITVTWELCKNSLLSYKYLIC